LISSGPWSAWFVTLARQTECIKKDNSNDDANYDGWEGIS